MLTVKEIKARINADAKSAKGLNKDIAVTALAIAEHVQAHGDCSLVALQMNAMPASLRRVALKTWYGAHFPVVIEGGKKGDKFVARLSEKAKNEKDAAKRSAMFDLTGAKANPWYEIAEKTPEEKEYTLAQIIAMIGRTVETIKAKKYANENDRKEAMKVADRISAAVAA